MSATRFTRLHLVILVASCATAGVFAAVLNPAELGFTTPDNSLQFKIDPVHPTYLVKSENVVTTGTPVYYVAPPNLPPGYLLYKISASHPFLYAVLTLRTANNGRVSIRTSKDGIKFATVFSSPPAKYGVEGAKVRLGRTIQGTRVLYVRVDLEGTRGGLQTNFHQLDGGFILDLPVSARSVVRGVVAGVVAIFLWWAYSLTVAGLTRTDWHAAAAADAIAHVPLLILLLYIPLSPRVPANLAGALLLYAFLGVLMVRIYNLIALVPSVSKPRLVASVVLMVALLASVLVFLRAIIIDSDGTAYYMYARSVLIDHDLDLRNEAADAWRLAGMGPQWELPRWPVTGAVLNPYTVGTSIAQLPFAFLGHTGAKLLNRFGVTVPLDGYSLPYQVGVASGSVLLTFLAFCLLARLLWKVYGPVIALLTVLGLWFGTVILCMAYFHPSMSHGPDLLVTVIFFSVWFAHRNETGGRSWMFRGMATGLCMLVRQQNLVMFTLLGYDAVVTAGDLWKASPSIRTILRYWVIAGVSAAAGFSVVYFPQIAYNLRTCRCLYFTGVSNLGLTFHWWRPQVVTVLFGTEHGLFLWTPITVPAVLGLGLLLRENRRLAVGYALIFAVTVYEIGLLGMFGGAGAGERYLINMTVPLAFGLATSIRYCARRAALGWVASGIGALVLLNVGVLSAYVLAVLPPFGRNLTLRDFWSAVLLRGPELVIESMDNVTYAYKPAFGIAANLVAPFVGGHSDGPLGVFGALAAVGVIAIGGLVAVAGVLGPRWRPGQPPTHAEATSHL